MSFSQVSTGPRSVRITTTTATETISGGAYTSSSFGASLNNVNEVAVFVAPTGSTALLGTGTLSAYLYNDLAATGTWARTPGLDLNFSGTSFANTSASAGYLGNSSFPSRGRILYLPNGITTATGAGLYIDINCVGMSNDGLDVSE